VNPVFKRRVKGVSVRVCPHHALSSISLTTAYIGGSSSVVSETRTLFTLYFHLWHSSSSQISKCFFVLPSDVAAKFANSCLRRIGRIELLQCLRNHSSNALHLESLVMYSSSEGSASTRPSPRHQSEEDISMYLDFSSPAQDPHQTTFQSSTMSQESSDSTPRIGGIRVSLACVPVSRYSVTDDDILTAYSAEVAM